MTSHNPHHISTVQCAGPGCTQLHLDSRGWFLICIAPGSFLCQPYSQQQLLPSDLPVCGHACAQKIFDRFLSQLHSARSAS